MSETIEVEKKIIDILQRVLEVDDCGDLVAAARRLRREKEIGDDLQRILKVNNYGDLVVAVLYLQREVKLYKKWIRAAAKIINVSGELMVPTGLKKKDWQPLDRHSLCQKCGEKFLE